MSTKKKIWFSVGAICLVAVVAVVAIVAVYAASQQTVTSNVNVSYTATDVIGSATANYYLGPNGEAKPFDGTAKWDGSGDDSNASLTPDGDIKLTRTNKFVVFEFIFSNDSTQHAYTAKLNYTATGTDENIEVKIKKDGAEVAASSRDWEESVASEPDSGASSTSGDLVTSVTVPANKQNYHVYVLVGVKDLTKNATFAGNFVWTLKNADAE